MRRHEGGKVMEARSDAERAEERRLKKVYSNLPPKQKALAEGLIVQAARLRCYLDELAADIEENGTTELFQQSEKVQPYVRTRPSAQLFAQLDKNYQSVIGKLDDMIVEDAPEVDDLAAFRRGS